MTANNKFLRTTKIEKSSKPGKTTALVTYEKGDKVKSNLTFEF
jgi:hypothetical protein